MTKHPNFRAYIKASLDDFYAKEVSEHGWSTYIKACAAKIFWITLLTKAATELPLFDGITNGFLKSVAVLAILAAINVIWDNCKEHAPDLIDEIATGNIAFKLDNKPLNSYIAAIVLGDIVLFGAPYIAKIGSLVHHPKNEK